MLRKENHFEFSVPKEMSNNDKANQAIEDDLNSIDLGQENNGPSEESEAPDMTTSELWHDKKSFHSRDDDLFDEYEASQEKDSYVNDMELTDKRSPQETDKDFKPKEIPQAKKPVEQAQPEVKAEQRRDSYAAAEEPKVEETQFAEEPVQEIPEPKQVIPIAVASKKQPDDTPFDYASHDGEEAPMEKMDPKDYEVALAVDKKPQAPKPVVKKDKSVEQKKLLD